MSVKNEWPTANINLAVVIQKSVVIFLCQAIFLAATVHILYCGRRHSERYDNTGLFTVTYQLIYRHCTCTVKGSWSTSD
jgi:hypothetical protein